VKLKKLLYIDNQGDSLWPATIPDLFTRKGFEITMIRADKDPFPEELTGYDCVFLSGSVLSVLDNLEWMQRERAWICKAAEQKLPMLGSCFGSQILAYALYGSEQVFRRKHCEVGFTTISLEKESTDPLLKDISEQEQMFVWHNDEVRAEHEDMIILGASADCPNHIWRYRGKPIWGIQGHPELDRNQLISVLQDYRRYFTRAGADVDALILQAAGNSRVIKLIENFIDTCDAKV
jgi:GMP synthase (glutamine-hydrolysing)